MRAGATPVHATDRCLRSPTIRPCPATAKAVGSAQVVLQPDCGVVDLDLREVPSGRAEGEQSHVGPTLGRTGRSPVGTPARPAWSCCRSPGCSERAEDEAMDDLRHLGLHVDPGVAAAGERPGDGGHAPPGHFAQRVARVSKSRGRYPLRVLMRSGLRSP